MIRKRAIERSYIVYNVIEIKTTYMENMTSKMADKTMKK